MDLSPGSVVAGRYRADRKVGAGGMGEVWAAEHLAIGVKVALKTLLGATASHHEVVARFNREAFLLGRVRSDHVSRVLDFVEDETWGLVIVMEFIEGRSLADRLDTSVMSVEDTVELAIDLTAALCDLHRASIVHRDLKPGNVILQPRSDGGTRAVVVDFGISRLLSEGKNDDEDTITGITKANMALGTVEYMAPEQILNSRDVTAVSDIYALGAILYRSLTGGHAYGQRQEDALARAKLIDDAPQLVLERKDPVARELTTVVMKAIQRRPVNRYKSAQDMLADLLPLRDLIKVAELELDATTTTDGTKALMGLMGLQHRLEPDSKISHPSAPDEIRESLTSTPEGEDMPTSRDSMGSLPEPAHAHSVPSAVATPLPTKKGVSKGVFATAITAAFAVGAAVAVAVMPSLRVPSFGAAASGAVEDENVVSGAVESDAPAPDEAVADEGDDDEDTEPNDDDETIDLDAEASSSAEMVAVAAPPPPKRRPAPAPRPPPRPAPPPSPPAAPPPKPIPVESPPDAPTSAPTSGDAAGDDAPPPSMPKKVDRPKAAPPATGTGSPKGAEAASR